MVPQYEALPKGGGGGGGGVQSIHPYTTVLIGFIYLYDQEVV